MKTFAAAIAVLTAFPMTLHATVLTLPLTSGTNMITGPWTDSPLDGAFNAYGDEAGFRYTTSGIYNPSGALYLHDDSGALRSDIWRLDGAHFTPTSMNIQTGDQIQRAGAGPAPADFLDYLAWSVAGIAEHAHVFFDGMRGGAVVAETEITGYAMGLFQFDSSFADIDRLSIRYVLPNGVTQHSFASAPGPLYCEDTCGGFVGSDLQVDLLDDPAPVPLPAGFLLLAGGLFSLTRLRRG